MTSPVDSVTVVVTSPHADGADSVSVTLVVVLVSDAVMPEPAAVAVAMVSPDSA